MISFFFVVVVVLFRELSSLRLLVETSTFSTLSSLSDMEEHTAERAILLVFKLVLQRLDRRVFFLKMIVLSVRAVMVAESMIVIAFLWS